MKKKTYSPRVLIANATDPRNIGDFAMLATLLELIRKNMPTDNITIHSTGANHYPPGFKAHKLDDTIYNYAALQDVSLIIKSWRMMRVTIYYLLFLSQTHIFDKYLKNDHLYDLFLDFWDSDIIFFVGGGYLRSKKGVTQSLNIIMQLLAFQISKYTKAKTIVCPISFGPFAYSWQQKLAAKVLTGLKIVTARENISYDLLTREKVSNLRLSSDHALLLKRVYQRKVPSSDVHLGVTLRQWLDPKKQLAFERSLANVILHLSKKHRFVIVPIAQVVNKKYGDIDDTVVSRFCKHLSGHGIAIRPLIKLKNLKHAIQVYSNLDILIGMRMHSNIIAATQGIPFLGIAYEHKTLGISKQLGLLDYCISAEVINEHNLTIKLEKLITRRNSKSKQMMRSVDKINIIENKRWSNILSI